MRVDCALIVTRAGGEKYVRKQMEDMADRLTGYENLFQKVSKNPTIKLLKPFLKGKYKRPA